MHAFVYSRGHDLVRDSGRILRVLRNLSEHFGAGGAHPSQTELLDSILKGFLVQGATISACGPCEVVLDGALLDEACLLQLSDALVIDLWVDAGPLDLRFAAIGTRTIRAERLKRDDSIGNTTIIKSLLVDTLLFPIHVQGGLLTLYIIELLDEIV